MSLIETRRVPVLYIGASILLIILFAAVSLSYILPQLNNQSSSQFSIGFFLAMLVAFAVLLFVRFGAKKGNRTSVTTTLT